MVYIRRTWQNAPSTATPLTAAALNNIEDGVVEALDGITELPSTYSPILDSFEMVTATQYGDSWGNNAVGTTADLTSAFMFRVCSRLRTLALTDRSVSATRSDQIQQRIAATWTAPGRGVVFIADNILNDAFQNRNTVTYKAATRSSYEYLSALNVSGVAATNVVYGPNWASGVSSTADSYADIAFTGDKVVIVSQGGVSGGVFRIRDAAGTVRATVTTSGWADTFGLTTRLTGFGSGNHTVRVEVVSGTVTLVGSLVPSTTPPLIVHNVPGTMAGSVGTVQNSKLPAFRTAVAEVAAEYSNVVLSDAGPDWDPALYLSTDETHLNDAGNFYLAARVIEALRGTPFQHGLNRMVVPAAYTLPTPAFSTPSATVPATVTGVDATTGYQVTVTWNATTDGGATLTGYIVQSSPDGTTWTTRATVLPSLTSTSISSGLTPSSSYQFRVLATNSVGTSAPSTTDTATAGPVLTTYSADALTGSGAMGNATTGGQAWTAYAGVTYARNAGGSGPTVSVTDRNYCTLDDAQADGVLSLKVATIGSVPGLAFRLAADLSTGYLFWNSGTTWTLSKQPTISTRTTVTSAAGTMVAGDVLSVVLSGSSIICKVNGVTVLTATDATYTGTRHGMYCYSATTSRFQDWAHTS